MIILTRTRTQDHSKNDRPPTGVQKRTTRQRKCRGSCRSTWQHSRLAGADLSGVEAASFGDMDRAGEVGEATRWRIHGERVVDDSRRGRLSIVEVELPDGVRFEQYVLRLRKGAIVAVVRERQVLMMWRHRFVIDRWVWELPGGYVDETEDAAVTAAREVEEETGWRPGSMERLMSFQPMVSTIDSENIIFLACDAEYVGEPQDINEAERVGWIDLDDVIPMIQHGEIAGSSSIVALLATLNRLG
jgi:8-oxo-dGTP pyrophosphatase MutT (NUDIX family)